MIGGPSFYCTVYRISFLCPVERLADLIRMVVDGSNDHIICCFDVNKTQVSLET